MKTLLFSMMLLALPILAQNRQMDPGQVIDHYAKVAKSGTDADVKNFVNVAVRPVGVPNFVADQFRSAIVTAEQEFRAGKHPGVTEQELLEFHNRLAMKLNLPTYAMVDKKQLRVMRILFMQGEPIAMAPNKQKPTDKEISPILSPVQAAHLESMIIMQKIANPVFQVEPNKWSLDLAKQLQHKESEKRLDKPSKSTDQITSDLPNAIEQGESNLSLSQAMDLLKDVNRTFKLHGSK